MYFSVSGDTAFRPVHYSRPTVAKYVNRGPHRPHVTVYYSVHVVLGTYGRYQVTPPPRYREWKTLPQRPKLFGYVLYRSTRGAVPERSWVQFLLPSTEVEPGFSTFGGMLVPVLQLISQVYKTGTSLPPYRPQKLHSLRTELPRTVLHTAYGRVGRPAAEVRYVAPERTVKPKRANSARQKFSSYGFNP
jgi:hypothetical protein